MKEYEVKKVRGDISIREINKLKEGVYDFGLDYFIYVDKTGIHDIWVDPETEKVCLL